jgi:tetratricopeptide (TPR) repeat protein
VTAAEWERLKPLFDEAIELTAAGRAEFVQKLRVDDPQVAAQLEPLLENQGAALENQGATETASEPLVRLKDSVYTERHFFKEGEMVIGRFRIVRFLGRGGMGEVYQAEDTQLGQVALKTLRPGGALDADSVLRFRQEVQLARRVTSTNVCRIHDLFQVPGDRDRLPCSFLTMELLPGVTLADHIQRDGPLPFAQAESVALQLCTALQAIHDAGVIHRDLKSRNIMLVPRNGEPHAVVMDLGLAREWEPSDTGDSGITKTGAVMGTPEYMAPEQFQGPSVTPAADIYALGVVLYELATGIRPFQSATPLGAVAKRAKHPAPVSSVRAGVPKHWDEVINRCLEYEPEKRWGSALEVAEVLKGIPALKAPSRLTISSVGMRRLAVATILAVAIAAGFLWYRSYSHPSPDAERWYQQGVAALREGTYLKSTQALERAVHLDKNFVLAHTRLADAWSELDFTGKAKDEILRASSLESRHGLASIDASYLDAVRATLTYDYADAVADYRRILGRLPEAEKAYGYVDLGRAEEKAADLPEALKDYAEAARRAPEDPASFVHLGIIESRQGKTADGESAFAKAEALYRASSNFEGTAEIAYQRGYAASVRGGFDDARKYLAQASHAAKDIPSAQLEIRALTRLSAVEYLADNTDQSISLANQAIQLARTKGLDYWAIDGLVRLGNAYLTRNDYAHAEPPLQEALRLASEGGRPRLAANAGLSLASIRNMQEKPDETITYAQKALDYYKPAGFFTESASALTLIVRSERDKAEFRPALARALEALNIVKKMNNPASLIQIEESVGSVLLDLERYPDALDHFQNALTAARSVNQLVEYELIHCADAFWRLGRYTEAESMLGAIPRDIAARSRIRQMIQLAEARILLSQNNFAGALRAARLGLADGKNLPPESAADMEVVAGTAAAHSPTSRGVAESFCRDAYGHAQEAMEPEAAAQAQLCQAGALLTAVDAQRALPLAESALKFFSASGQHESEWQSLLYLSRIHKSAGETTAARTDASEALEIIARDEHDWASSFQTYARRLDVMAARKELAETNRNRETLQK